MKILNFLLVFILILNCKEKTLKTENSEILENENSSQNLKIEYGKKFFEYDEVSHYSINISEDEATKLLDNHTSKNDEKKYDIIMNDKFPKTIKEINFENKLSNFGFMKSEIKSENFNELNQIFVEKSEQDGIVSACIPIFRDLLIFKNKNHITGFVKICFECKHYHIIGTNAETKNFGQSQDFEKLEKILARK